MIATLNWKEIARLTESLQAELARATPLSVDKIAVPERKRFASGYVKGEWILHLGGRKASLPLLISVRPRQPYLSIYSGPGTPRSSSRATRSPFDQFLSKQLTGAKWVTLEAVARERVVIVWFEASASGSATALGGARNQLGLILSLIPAQPEALLVERSAGAHAPWKILARSRGTQESDPGEYMPPDGAHAPDTLTVREELVDPAAYLKHIERELEREAFAARLQQVERALKERFKQARDRIGVSTRAREEAGRESEWKRYGDLLKAALPSPAPVGADGWREVLDYETGETTRIPSDPKLAPREQVERFYQLARRKQRRLEEAQSRIGMFTETLTQSQAALASLPSPLAPALEWEKLEVLERSLGIEIAANAGPESAATKKSSSRKAGAWMGKTFTSKDGTTIWIGRNKDENLELTFKHARGNDLWLHVRGKPGAHAVIPLSSGKSASLETLLDAATLVVYYSKGENWGKTEVDYTFKKYVKRIRDSTEASYTHNKTLILEMDPARLKRLFL